MRSKFYHDTVLQEGREAHENTRKVLNKERCDSFYIEVDSTYLKVNALYVTVRT